MRRQSDAIVWDDVELAPRSREVQRPGDDPRVAEPNRKRALRAGRVARCK